MVGDDHAAPAIIGPLDGSEPSRRTTGLAARLARRMGWRLALVPLPLGSTPGDRRDRLVAAALDERAELIASPATNDAPGDGAGVPACLALAATAPCPVLAVPLCGRAQPTASGPIVCGIDGSDSSATVARAAACLATALDARLAFVHVDVRPENGAERRVDPSGAFRDVLRRALRTLDAMPPVDLVFEVGEPARRLCTLAESEHALLVIGAPANAAPSGGRDGGVASTIVVESHVPVVLVPVPQ